MRVMQRSRQQKAFSQAANSRVSQPDTPMRVIANKSFVTLGNNVAVTQEIGSFQNKDGTFGRYH
ncbi:hypothetical protein Pla52o_22060 [Novipirellula galeiformis]|uniref:Uncharacterized protein n=1 Tax=Novipirellula galeiformis TaxID=2528004 RepID=A0A5C6CNE2_9BACT|nr:hypothetical protein Pla52o_22060 [Novipirellula galeiformis]